MITSSNYATFNLICICIRIRNIINVRFKIQRNVNWSCTYWKHFDMVFKGKFNVSISTVTIQYLSSLGICKVDTNT